MNQLKFWNTTIIYTIGFLGLRALSFILLPIYTNLLTTQQAGILFIIYTILAFCNTIYNRGMDSALLKFFRELSEKSLISTSILYSGIYGIILSVILLLFYYCAYYFEIFQLHDISSYIGLFLVIILFCDMLSSRCMHIVRLKNKPWYYLIVSFVNVISSLLLNIYFIIHLNLGLNGAILALLYVSIIQLAILLPYIYNKLSINSFDKNLLIKMKEFSWPFLPAAIFFILIELSDRWFIGLLSQNTAADVGLYGTGYKIGSIMLLIIRGFNLSWQPYYLKESYTRQSIKRFGIIGTDFINLMVCFSTLIILIYPILLQNKIFGIYLIGESFWPGLTITPIILLSYIFYGVFILQMPSIYLTNKQKWAPVLWGAGFIINCILNVLLIPSFGFIGAAMSTLIAYFTMMLFIIYKNYSWMKISYNMTSILKMLFASSVLYFIYYLSLTHVYSIYITLISCFVYIIFTLKYMVSKNNVLL
tara:strand:+ start:285 stop:1712 length:1428 start_codon:yes stop_codon:yes gene_type:complete